MEDAGHRMSQVMICTEGGQSRERSAAKSPERQDVCAKILHNAPPDVPPYLDLLWCGGFGIAADHQTLG